MERSSRAHQLGHKHSGAQTSDYLVRNASVQNTAQNNLGLGSSLPKQLLVPKSGLG